MTPSPNKLGSGKVLLMKRLASLDIPAVVVPYPAHETVEQGKQLRGNMAGTFTKNLLLKDKKARLFLFSIHEDRGLDLKTLHTKVGANGRLGFAAPERMVELLGVEPGALTPLGLVHDTDAVITTVVDADLLAAKQINFHPLVHTESIGLAPEELLRFIRSCNREPMVINFDE